ncbi:hypothetical protein KKC97_02585 [bacterium]|nr:hypothetical protein [bacterium]
MLQHDWIVKQRPVIEVLALWLFCRMLMLFLVDLPGSDLPLYESIAARLSEGLTAYRDFPLDHPPVALFFIWLPSVLSGLFSYLISFRLILVVCDLAILMLLRHLAYELSHETSAGRSASALYLWLTALLFPLVFDRIDLIPALLTLLLVTAGHYRKWGIGYVLLVAGVGLNAGIILLWPCWITSHVMLGKSGRRAIAQAAAAMAALTGLIWIGIEWAGSGFIRCLDYNWSRGVEIESFAGSFVLLARWFGFDAVVDFSTGAGRLAGPAVTFAGLIAVAVAAAVGIYAWFIVFRRTTRSCETKWWISCGILAHLLIFLLSTMTFLPQFLLWLIPIVSLLFVVVSDKTGWGVLWIGVALFTTSVFPFNFGELLRFEWWAVLLMISRNLCLLGLLFWTIRLWTDASSPRPLSDPRSPRP